MKKKQKSFVFRIMLMTLAVLILSTASIGIFSYILNRNNAISLNAERALAISRSVVSAIDPDQFVEIMWTKEKNEHWYSVKAYIDDVYNKNNLLYLYILIKHTVTR